MVHRAGWVWFKADESFDPDHVEQIARALVEELDLDGTSYALGATYAASQELTSSEVGHSY